MDEGLTEAIDTFASFFPGLQDLGSCELAPDRSVALGISGAMYVLHTENPVAGIEFALAHDAHGGLILTSATDVRAFRSADEFLGNARDDSREAVGRLVDVILHRDPATAFTDLCSDRAAQTERAVIALEGLSTYLLTGVDLRPDLDADATAEVSSSAEAPNQGDEQVLTDAQVTDAEKVGAEDATSLAVEALETEADEQHDPEPGDTEEVDVAGLEEPLVAVGPDERAPTRWSSTVERISHRFTTQTKLMVGVGLLLLVVVALMLRSGSTPGTYSTGWQEIETSAESPRTATGLAASDGRLIALGSEVGDHAVWISPDARTWFRSEVEPGTFQGAEFEDVAAWEDGFLIFGSAAGVPVVWTSSDGEVWARSPLAGAVFDGAEVNDVTAFADGFVAFGSQAGVPMVWNSSDAQDWDRSELDPAVFSGATVLKVAEYSGGFVALGRSNDAITVWTSRDAQGWVRFALRGVAFDGAEIADVEALGEGFLVLGSQAGKPVVWTSPNGRDWDRSELRLGAVGRVTGLDVVAHGEGLVAEGEVGGATTLWRWTSAD